MLTHLMQPTNIDETRTLSITDAAVQRLQKVLQQETQEHSTPQMLRIRVDGGGCSGFQYAFSFDSVIANDDRVFHYNTITVVIDDVSLGLVAGSCLDFEANLMSAAFVIKNPNATASCGCGNSFSVF